jgi:hypothetical protein
VCQPESSGGHGARWLAAAGAAVLRGALFFSAMDMEGLTHVEWTWKKLSCLWACNMQDDKAAACVKCCNDATTNWDLIVPEILGRTKPRSRTLFFFVLSIYGLRMDCLCVGKKDGWIGRTIARFWVEQCAAQSWVPSFMGRCFAHP